MPDLSKLTIDIDADPIAKALEALNARIDEALAERQELLDALKGMVGLIELIYAREPSLKFNHRYVAAIAAIAKAEGR